MGPQPPKYLAIFVSFASWIHSQTSDRTAPSIIFSWQGCYTLMFTRGKRTPSHGDWFGVLTGTGTWTSTPSPSFGKWCWGKGVSKVIPPACALSAIPSCHLSRLLGPLSLYELVPRFSSFSDVWTSFKEKTIGDSQGGLKLFFNHSFK